MMACPTTSTPNQAETYMRRARIITTLLRDNSSTNYESIAEHLFRSRTNAGGPALRLAHAILCFEVRRRFPTPANKLAEQEAYGQLLHGHECADKARHYHVWQAIRAFKPLREKQFGPEAAAPLFKQELAQIDWSFTQALYRVHHWANVTRKPYLRSVLGALLQLDPTSPDMLAGATELSKAVYNLEYWRESACTDPHRKRFYLHYLNRFRHHLHSHPWLKKTSLALAEKALNDSFTTPRP